MNSQEQAARSLRGSIIRRSGYRLRPELLFRSLMLVYLALALFAVGIISGLSDTESETVSIHSILNAHILSLRGSSTHKSHGNLRDQKNHENAGSTEKEPPMNPKGSSPFPYYPASKVSEDHDFKQFKPSGGNRFEEYKHGDSPYSYSAGESDELARSRRYHVKKALQHTWAGYEKYAFGMDELHPISKTGNRRWGGIGTTLVDSLDTLWLMDLKDEFYRARDWVKTTMNHNIDKNVSVFETTIRSLGGLLSAYDWSQDRAFLDQAEDLGSRLFKAFDSDSGIPYAQTNLQSGRNSNQNWSPQFTSIAEAGSLQIEFRALGRLSGIMAYKTKSEKVFSILDAISPTNGLYPTKLTNKMPMAKLMESTKTFGPMADSFYEYMLKIWIQGGQTETQYREMYDKSIQGMHDQLLSVSTPSELVFIADQTHGKMVYEMDHLVCFMGGVLALGAYTDPQGLHSERAERDLKTAKVSNR